MIEGQAGPRIGASADALAGPGHESRKRRARIVRHFFFFWYMASMRCVTRKPPKMLIDAKISATKPSARAQIGPASFVTRGTPTASRAPTTITEEIALVTDISGVCRAGVTDHTT